jgi:hypothetical protein
MFNNTENIIVPAGNFVVSNAQDIVIKNDNGNTGWTYWGTTRYNDNQFANNIGLIRSEIFFISSTEVTVKELISYHLN